MEARSIVVAGAGGNTGSHLLPHLARMSGMGRLTLVDPEFYEAGNVAVQNIESLTWEAPRFWHRLKSCGALGRVSCMQAWRRLPWSSGSKMSLAACCGAT